MVRFKEFVFVMVDGGRMLENFREINGDTGNSID